MKNVILNLIAAQKEFPPIPKNSTGQIGTRTYKYADLLDVLAIVTPVLNKNGLALSQVGSALDNGKMALSTMLMHAASGEMIESRFFLPDVADPQKFGAALTYYRRYAICALLSVVADDDVDGAINNAKPQGQSAKPQSSSKPNPDQASVKPPQAQSPSQPPSDPSLISEAQLKRMFALQAKVQMPDEVLKNIAAGLGITTRKAILKSKYTTLCNLIEKWSPEL